MPALAIEPEVALVVATAPVAEPIESAVATFPAVVAAIAMLSVGAPEAVPVDMTVPARGPAAAAALPA